MAVNESRSMRAGLESGAKDGRYMVDSPDWETNNNRPQSREYTSFIPFINEYNTNYMPGSFDI